jgi:hypothetical protein
MDKKEIIFVGLFVMCIILFILVVSTALKYLIRKNHANDYYFYLNSEFDDSEFRNKYKSISHNSHSEPIDTDNHIDKDEKLNPETEKPQSISS